MLLLHGVGFFLGGEWKAIIICIATSPRWTDVAGGLLARNRFAGTLSSARNGTKGI